MFRIEVIQVLLLALVVTQTLSGVYTPSVWKYEHRLDEQRFWLNTYDYCNNSSEHSLEILR
jgi:hypothetical protein